MDLYICVQSRKGGQTFFQMLDMGDMIDFGQENFYQEFGCELSVASPPNSG